MTTNHSTAHETHRIMGLGRNSKGNSPHIMQTLQVRPWIGEAMRNTIVYIPHDRNPKNDWETAKSVSTVNTVNNRIIDMFTSRCGQQFLYWQQRRSIPFISISSTVFNHSLNNGDRRPYGAFEGDQSSQRPVTSHQNGPVWSSRVQLSEYRQNCSYRSNEHPNCGTRTESRRHLESSKVVPHFYTELYIGRW